MKFNGGSRIDNFLQYIPPTCRIVFMKRDERDVLSEICFIFPELERGETGPDSGQPGRARAQRWEELEQALQESTSRGLYQSVSYTYSGLRLRVLL